VSSCSQCHRPVRRCPVCWVQGSLIWLASVVYDTLWVRQMWSEPGVCVVCIYRGVNKWCLPVDGCLAAPCWMCL
jgi:hypothetical protein